MSKNDKSANDKSKKDQSGKSKSNKAQEVAVSAKKSKSPALFDRQIEDLFEDFIHRRWPKFGELTNLSWPRFALSASSGQATKLPSMDVIDRDKEIIVRAELPGIDKQDIEVSVSGNSVTVQGSTRKENEADKEQYHHREIVSSFVSRTMPLPCEVDGDNAVARMTNGVLEVTIPKIESAKRKKLEIQS